MINAQAEKIAVFVLTINGIAHSKENKNK